MEKKTRKVCITWKECGKQKKAIMFKSSVWTLLLNLYDAAAKQKTIISGVTFSNCEL